MLTMFLVFAIFAAAGYFLFDWLDYVFGRTDFWRETKVGAAVIFGFGGLFFGAVFLNEKLCALVPPDSYEKGERIYLSPIEGSIYMAINKTRKSKWQAESVQFLKKDRILEIRTEGYNFLKESVVFLPDDINLAWIQEIKPARKGVWRYFIMDSNKEFFFIPPSGARYGKIETIEMYKFIP